MEYFDFEDASHALPPFDLDDCSSLICDINQDEANECFDSLFFDKTKHLPAGRPAQTTKLKLINNVEIEVVPAPGDPNLNYPMFRAKEPCELCTKMGLDCFLASRGTLVTGCTCCISLYRECSFTHSKMPKGFISTFPGISEDAQVCQGRITEQRKAMRSFEDARGRKTGARFPRDAVKILKQWLGEHADHPYPNEREKDELKQLTGLKRSQISNWLANSRRRGKVRPSSGPSSPMLGAIDIPQPRESSDMADLNPLDRWKASPPEHEPASMTAIARAVTATPLPGRKSSQSSLHGGNNSSSNNNNNTNNNNSRHGSRTSSRKASSEEDSSLSMFRAPSVSSFETRESSNSDLSFAASSRSNRSKGSFSSSIDRRRRRRAPMTQRNATQQAKTRSARIFQCTFCTDTFPAKYDWQRHEKSLHLALERWTCCPDNNTGIHIDQSTGSSICIFCNYPNPDSGHLETMHNFIACQEKTLQERTFYRKDHLRQHLKLMHSTKFLPHMESWKSQTNEIRSACGFCPSKFTTWQQRADHLAAHFRNGADMSQWANGWGFEPWVERLVENAIPPYLIGHERSTMQPYVARYNTQGQPQQMTTATPSGSNSGATTTDSSAANTGMTFGSSAETSASSSSQQLDLNLMNLTTEPEPEPEVDQMTKDSNCWNRLQQELTKFVLQQRAQGHVPSDKQIQDRARFIIYEDEDPWNWTCADNQQWLDTFKFQCGIGGVTDIMEVKEGGADVLATTTTQPVRQLEEVPIMAPYVVKGGLKNQKSSLTTGATSRISMRASINSEVAAAATDNLPTSMANLFSTPAAAPSRYESSLSNAISRSASLNHTPAFDLDLDQNMDLNPEDFDSLDFSGLDLGMMMADDVNFETGLEAHEMLGGGGGGNGGQDLGLDGMDMNMDMGVGVGVNVNNMMSPGVAGMTSVGISPRRKQQRQQQQSQQQQQPIMTDREMWELANYTAGFQ